jgi:tetratricopeptide (TPR) repeat protein
LAIARKADPDEWRNRLRDPSVARDRQALEQLASRPEVASLPPSTTVLLGRMLDAAGASERAVAVLSAGQLRYPDDLWLNFDLSLFSLWRFSPPRRAAAEYARAALALRPHSAGLYTHLGDTLRAPTRLDESIAAHRRAIQLKPDYAVAYKALGCALADKGALEEAIAAYEQGIRLAPTMPNTHRYLAHAFSRARQFDKAIDALREATRVWPGDATAHAWLGWILANHPEPSSRDTREALERARKAVELAPNFGNSWECMGAACYRTGDWAGAIAAMEKARQLFGAGSSSYQFTWLAMAHWQRGDKDQARLWFDRSAQWLDENREKLKTDPGLSEHDLRRLHAEAAELLGVTEGDEARQ